MSTTSTTSKQSPFPSRGEATKRQVIVRDSLDIAMLALITCILFAITWFLFRSFSEHRTDLAQRWSARGLHALGANRPREAVADMRTALTYAPGTRDYDLLLAEAFSAGGQIDESYNYFLSLWETQPGDGYINLSLARLAARKEKPSDAIGYYRAAIYGTWNEHNGVTQRAKVRLELARYLLSQHDLLAARAELSLAADNTPEDFDRDITLGDLFQQAADPSDALTYYKKAIARQPSTPAALEAAGRLSYSVGDYQDAKHLYQRAQVVLANSRPPAQLGSADEGVMNDATRILQLMVSPTLPPREQTARLLADRAIARKRFDSCSAYLTQGATPAWQALAARWSGREGTISAAALMRDSSIQTGVLGLIYDTEIEAQKNCSPASGDDALLLRLAPSNDGTARSDAEWTANGKGSQQS